MRLFSPVFDAAVSPLEHDVEVFADKGPWQENNVVHRETLVHASMLEPVEFAVYTFAMLVICLLCVCIHHKPSFARDAHGELCALRCAGVAGCSAGAVALLIYASGKLLCRATRQVPAWIRGES